MERCDKVTPEKVTTFQRSHNNQQEEEGKKKNGNGEHMWQGSPGEASQRLEM